MQEQEWYDFEMKKQCIQQCKDFYRNGWYMRLKVEKEKTETKEDKTLDAILEKIKKKHGKNWSNFGWSYYFCIYSCMGKKNECKNCKDWWKRQQSEFIYKSVI